MDIKILEEENRYLVEMDGPIKSVTDSSDIKEALNSCGDTSKAVVIKITNSFSVTSSVIGFLLKKVQVDNFKISLEVADNRLYELFDTLNLIEALNVTKSA
ncbi:MAG: hypothetical protein ACTTIC_06645 [Helicobacteraceae bacterium]